MMDAEGTLVDLRRARRGKFRQQRLQTNGLDRCSGIDSGRRTCSIGQTRMPTSTRRGCIASELSVKGFDFGVMVISIRVLEI
jgi:hypothetical protein